MAMTPAVKGVAVNAIRQVGYSADIIIASLESTMRVLERRLLLTFGESTLTQTVDVALARAQVEAILLETGLYEQMGALLNDNFQQAIDTAYDTYKKLYPSKVFQFTGDSLQRLSVLKELDFTAMQGVTSKLADEITAGIVRYQYGALNREGVLAVIEEQTGKTGHQLATQFNTALFGFYQAANNELAEELGIEEFAYIGPDDDLTRDFCWAILVQDRNWTKDEILALDNGQGLPVFEYGGGYNCRHVWAAVG